MEIVTLGRTRIKACKNGFGALPIQRIGKSDAVYLLQKAFYSGMNFFDTARAYSDSEEKIGAAFEHIRSKLFISTKSVSLTAEGFRNDLETSLRLLRTDYIDIIQFHNPPFCPKPGDESGLFDAAREAQAQGKVRFIGITNHRQNVAREALASGLYDTLQFPFSYLASDADIAIVRECAERNVGLLAMKALSGGLITDSAAAYAFVAQYENALPIWGVQREKELDEFLSYNAQPPVLDDRMRRLIAKDRAELVGRFCRGCGYCLPCPADIDIPNCARMAQLIRRAPQAGFLTPQWQEKMKKIEACIHCNHCKSHCPYGLDTPELLAKHYADYKTFL